jgi:hypothetical protein
MRFANKAVRAFWMFAVLLVLSSMVPGGLAAGHPLVSYKPGMAKTYNLPLPVPPQPGEPGVCDTVMVCVCPLVFCELTGGPVCYEVAVLCD